MTSSSVEIREWERAEVVRSAIEAAHTNDAALRMSPREVARYLNPPADTAYPLEYAFHLLGDVKGKVVLDFGCGSGMNAALIAARGARVVGFDISEDLVRLAPGCLAVNGVPGGADFMVSSAHDLPIASDSIDVVFGIAILHHLDLDRVSREVYRVLRPGGRAIFQEPVRNSAIIRAVRAMFPNRDHELSPYERPLTDGELAGFGRRYRTACARPFWLPHVRLAARLPVSWVRLEPVYQSDALLLRRFPRLATYAAVRVIELTK